MTEERKSDFTLTTDTPYLDLKGDIWGVCCEDLGENWSRYIGTVLYHNIPYKALFQYETITPGMEFQDKDERMVRR